VTAPALARSTPTGRVYEHPRTGKQWPSITNAIGVIDKPALKFWAARQCAEFTADNLDSLGPLDRQSRIDLVRGAPFRSSGNAANIGDIVHDTIDKRIKGQQVDTTAFPPSAQKCMRSFAAFERTYKPRWIESEFTVWSDTYGYAGTADWSAYVGDWTVLGDTKTGKAVYPEVGLQIAAIASADFILDIDGTERPLPDFDRFAVLHIRPTFARLIPLDINGCLEAFNHAVALKRWKDVDSVNVIQAAPKVPANSNEVLED
jgi:hypothetical protein